jgi:hypothetical protein
VYIYLALIIHHLELIDQFVFHIVLFFKKQLFFVYQIAQKLLAKFADYITPIVVFLQSVPFRFLFFFSAA